MDIQYSDSTIVTDYWDCGDKKVKSKFLYYTQIVIMGLCLLAKYITTDCQTKTIMEQSRNERVFTFVKSNGSQ